jgi:hypothetical protein
MKIVDYDYRLILKNDGTYQVRSAMAKGNKLAPSFLLTDLSVDYNLIYTDKRPEGDGEITVLYFRDKMRLPSLGHISEEIKHIDMQLETVKREINVNYGDAIVDSGVSKELTHRRRVLKSRRQRLLDENK